ncbi:unnamed protein product [Auanema sp. JU1783]|nr:unnamed protein product [Auanema sp. JU1783]
MFFKTFRENFFDRRPFPHYLFQNFIENSSGVVEDLELELQEFPNWKRKENDLYSLYQTNDFKSFKTFQYPELYSFRQFLSQEVKVFLQNITEVELIEEIDVNGSCYSEFDGLLPHNDLIETRKFAFVYYLSPYVWKKEYGGQLILFNSDNEELPVTEAKEIYPARNALMIFEVSNKSWHAVKEIMTKSYPRLSINGWFHSLKPQHKAVSNSTTNLISFHNPLKKGVPQFDVFLNDWCKNDACISNVQEKFADTSECCIAQFLKMQCHNEMLNILRCSEFEEVGPLNKCKIYENLTRNRNSSLSQFLNSFRTTEALKFISRLTGCMMKDCKISTSVYKILKGCYTVVGDDDLLQFQHKDYALETYLFLGEGQWSKDFGGRISYIGNDDEEELVTFYPQSNSFTMVLRDSGAASFLKYINSSCCIEVYMICIRYHNVKIEND